MKRQCFGCGFKYGNVVAGTADAPQQRPSGRVPVKDFNVFTFASSIWIKPANGTHLWLKSRQRRGFHREADFSHWHYQAVVILYSCRRLQDPPFAHTPPPTSDRTRWSGSGSGSGTERFRQRLTRSQEGRGAWNPGLRLSSPRSSLPFSVPIYLTVGRRTFLFRTGPLRHLKSRAV